MTSIVIENLWKSYRRGKTKVGNLKGSITYFWNTLGTKSEDFNALEAINLQIEEGEIVGILGPNGAGKSTLLKIISRITFPTKGRVILNGNLSSLLEIGVGFHPELTGRENIYLSGTIHGMSKQELDAKFDRIVDFSGQEMYLNTPVKHYSSGMYMRLAFAVSAHLEPDILIIDEVLAVGDQDFRKKCIRKIKELYESGKTVLLVSHQMEYLSELCTRGVCMQQGRIVHDGPIQDVILQYVESGSSGNTINILERKDRKGTGQAIIVNIEVCDREGHIHLYPGSGQYVIIKIFISSTLTILQNVAIRLNCFDILGQQWFVMNSKLSDGNIEKCPGNTVLECHIPKLPLSTGRYYFDVSLSVNHVISDLVAQAFEMIVVDGLFYETGMLPPASNGVLVDYKWIVSDRS